MKRRKWPATFNLFDHLLWLWRNCIQILNTILTIVFEHDMIEFWCLAIIIDYLSHWFRIFSIFACINFTFFQGKPRIEIILYDVTMTWLYLKISLKSFITPPWACPVNCRITKSPILYLHSFSHFLPLKVFKWTFNFLVPVWNFQECSDTEPFLHFWIRVWKILCPALLDHCLVVQLFLGWLHNLTLWKVLKLVELIRWRLLQKKIKRELVKFWFGCWVIWKWLRHLGCYNTHPVLPPLKSPKGGCDRQLIAAQSRKSIFGDAIEQPLIINWDKIL